MSTWDQVPRLSRDTYWRCPKVVPERHVDDAVRAWKIANYCNGRFLPLHVLGTYGPTAIAQCMARDRMLISNDDHGPAPQLHCTCGFYALRQPGSSLAYLASAGESSFLLLEVNLSGVVIAHQRGYRAERQQVITVYAPWTRFATVSAGFERAEDIERAIGVPVRKLDKETTDLFMVSE